MTPPRTPTPKTKTPRSRTAKKLPGRTSRATSKVLARRPERSLRVVIMMTEDEQQRLITLCEDDVRPISSWFRVVVRRAWLERRPAKKAKRFQRRSDDGLVRHVEVWTRLSEEERDQLDVLAGEEDVSLAVWFRKRLAESWAAYQRAAKKAPRRTR